MKIHHLRNAASIIKVGSHRILVDPMLTDQGTMPAYVPQVHPPLDNPLVELPEGATAAMANATAALVTHCHKDHLDEKGVAFLNQHQIPTYGSEFDQARYQKRGLDAHLLELETCQDFLDGQITPILTQHGHGETLKLMGQGVGYFIELPGRPTIYIAGDTVLTERIKTALSELKPDVAIINAGGAQWWNEDDHILMSLSEILEFIRLTDGQVVAVHMEALNHCRLSRDQLRQAADEAGLGHKLDHSLRRTDG